MHSLKGNIMKSQISTAVAALFPASHVAIAGFDDAALIQTLIVLAIAVTNFIFKRKSEKAQDLVADITRDLEKAQALSDRLQALVPLESIDQAKKLRAMMGAKTPKPPEPHK